MLRSVEVKTTPNRTATVATGSSSGRLTWKSRRQNEAPSMTAASRISTGMAVSPASTITVAKGNIRQTCTMIIAMMASVGSPSQYSQPLYNPPALRVQLTTLKVESKIQVQAIAASETGTAHGRRRSIRTARFPKKAASRTLAAVVARTITSTCETTVKTIVFRRVSRNWASAMIVAKLCSPTQGKDSVPDLAALKLSRMARTKGTPTSTMTYRKAGARRTRPSACSRSARGARRKGVAAGWMNGCASLRSAILPRQPRAAVEIPHRPPRDGKLVDLLFRDRRRDGHGQGGDHRLVRSQLLLQLPVDQTVCPQVLDLSHAEVVGEDTFLGGEGRARQKVLRPESEDRRLIVFDQVHRWRAEKGGDEGVRGVLIHVLRISNLPHLALVHHDDAVAQAHRLHLIVRHVDGCRAELPLELLEFVAGDGPQLRIQVGEGLVEEKDLRVPHHRPGQGDALPLATGELARKPVEQPLDAEHARAAVHPLFQGRRGHPHRLQREGDVAVGGLVRIEGVALEDHGDAAGTWRDVLVHALSRDVDLTGGGHLQTGDHAHQGGLAAAGRTEEDEKLALLDLQIDAVNRPHVAEVFVQIACFHVHHRCPRGLTCRGAPRVSRAHPVSPFPLPVAY